MKLAFLVNRIAEERPEYTTSVLAATARARGHDVWYLGMEDFAYDPDNLLRARALPVPEEEDTESLIEALQGDGARRERIGLEDLDVLFLRNDPAVDAKDRAWAQNVGIIFGQMAVRHGVLVVNDPFGLSQALNKLYFQHFPADVRPKTLITRDREEIREFYREHHGSVILKPLTGSGGQGVFLVREDDESNLNQMVEAIARDGYVVAQEYLTEAAEGDLRLFLLDGAPLRHEGRYAAMFRRAAEGEVRSNMHVGGSAEKAEVDERALRVADLVRPKLVEDGMFLVGLDIAGDKLLEVNVFSPGGLFGMGRLEKVNFGEPVIDALERKVAYVRCYGRNFRNADLAML